MENFNHTHTKTLNISPIYLSTLNTRILFSLKTNKPLIEYYEFQGTVFAEVKHILILNTRIFLMVSVICIIQRYLSPKMDI